MKSSRTPADVRGMGTPVWRLLHAVLFNLVPCGLTTAYLLVLGGLATPYIWFIALLIAYAGADLQKRWHDRLDADLEEQP